MPVPTALERKGDFQQSLNNNGANAHDQRPDHADAVPGQWWFRTNRLYAPGQALLNLLSPPNVTQVTELQLHFAASRPSPRREDLLRLDYNVSDKLRVFGHWIDDQYPTESPYGSFVLGPTVPITRIANTRPGHSFAAGATWTISPTMTNESTGASPRTIDISSRRRTSFVATHRASTSRCSIPMPFRMTTFPATIQWLASGEHP